MDSYTAMNGDSFNGQFKQFGGTPSVEIKFEQESYNDVNSLAAPPYNYAGNQVNQFDQNVYAPAYNQEYNGGTDGGIQPAQVTPAGNFNADKAEGNQKVSPSSKKTNQLQPSQDVGCDVCGKVFSSNASMRRHREIHAGLKKFACDLCGNSYTQKHNLTKHMRLHTGEKPYQCKLCDKTFYIHHHLKTHMAQHNGEVPYKCTQCGKGYRQKNKLDHHIRNQHAQTGDGSVAQSPPSVITSDDNSTSDVWGIGNGDDNDDNSTEMSDSGLYDSFPDDDRTIDEHECEVCQQLFINKESLDNHMKINHAVDKEFKCDDCGHIFLTRAHLVRHRRSHTGEQIFECDECRVSFRFRVSLHIHMRRHNNDYKRYECSLCNKYFLAKESLKKHTNSVHYGMHIYECDECGDRFTQKAEYKSHLIEHEEAAQTTKVKPQPASSNEPKKIPTCKTCQKTFSSNSSLRKHEYTHMDVKPHKCELCNVSFAQKIQLRLHNKRHNGGKMEPPVIPVKKKGSEPTPKKNIGGRPTNAERAEREKRLSLSPSTDTKEEEQSDEEGEATEHSAEENRELTKVRIKLNNVEGDRAAGHERRNAAQKARKIFQELNDTETEEDELMEEENDEGTVNDDINDINDDDTKEVDAKNEVKEDKVEEIEEEQQTRRPLRMKIKTNPEPIPERRNAPRRARKSLHQEEKQEEGDGDDDGDDENDDEDDDNDGGDDYDDERSRDGSPAKKKGKYDGYRYPVCKHCDQVFKKTKALKRHVKVCKKKN